MPTAQVADFAAIFRVRCTVAKERLAERFLSVVFSDVPGSRKSSQHASDLGVFGQKYRSCMSALACKIERLCLVPYRGKPGISLGNVRPHLALVSPW